MESVKKLEKIIKEIESAERDNMLSYGDLQKISSDNEITILQVMNISRNRKKYKRAIKEAYSMI